MFVLNLKIVTGISIMFLFTFSSLLMSEKILLPYAKSMNIELTEEERSPENYFFTNKFPDNRTIFLVGSSHTGALNVTTINNFISSNMTDIPEIPIVYNLAKPGNSLLDEFRNLKNIIYAKPKIIFLGISYRDFQFPFNAKNVNALLPDPKNVNALLPDPKIMVSNGLHFFIAEKIVPPNPQFLTQYIISELLFDGRQVDNEKSINGIRIPKTPFIGYESDWTILSDDELQKYPVSVEWIDPTFQYRNIDALYEYIQQAQDNGIKVIIFSTPLQKYYLQALSDSQKKSFSLLLDNLSEEHGVKVYDFEKKYSELDIWRNPSHVYTGNNVNEFNNDISRMIILEYKK